ncbi:hypothetical protein J1605_013017 [Eschrichtius robustus]|uniref:Collagen alpha-1(I) chain-like n=1 Tax=Eschrichtius robustus TaxID=9764 RepID=A0AB34GK18_ESCRO|nr:hypothetical protein J1605_013017 [Eschrichtius robustus]
MVWAELETSGSRRKDQLDQRHTLGRGLGPQVALVPLGSLARSQTTEAPRTSVRAPSVGCWKPVCLVRVQICGGPCSEDLETWLCWARVRPAPAPGTCVAQVGLVSHHAPRDRWAPPERPVGKAVGQRAAGKEMLPLVRELSYFSDELSSQHCWGPLAAAWPGERGCSSPGEQASPGPVLSWQHKVRKGYHRGHLASSSAPWAAPPTSSSTQGIGVEYARVLTPGHRCPVFLGCRQAAGDPALLSGISQAGPVLLPGPQRVLRFTSPPSPGRQGERSRGQPEHHHAPLDVVQAGALVPVSPPETSIHSWALAGGAISASGRVCPWGFTSTTCALLHTSGCSGPEDPGVRVVGNGTANPTGPGLGGPRAAGVAEWRFGKTPKSPHAPCPPHHEAAPPVGARGVATRRGGGPGAPGVTWRHLPARRSVSPVGLRARGRRAARAGGRNPSLWSGPGPRRARPPTRSESRGLGSLWPQGDPPARTPQNSGGPRGSTRGARDRGSVQPCALGPFRPGAWPPAALGRDTPLALGLGGGGGAWWRLDSPGGAARAADGASAGTLLLWAPHPVSQELLDKREAPDVSSGCAEPCPQHGLGPWILVLFLGPGGSLGLEGLPLPPIGTPKTLCQLDSGTLPGRPSSCPAPRQQFAPLLIWEELARQKGISRVTAPEQGQACCGLQAPGTEHRMNE